MLAVLQAGGGAQHAEIVVVCGTFFIMTEARRGLGISFFPLLSLHSRTLCACTRAGIVEPRDPVDLNEHFGAQTGIPLLVSHPLHPDNVNKTVSKTA